MERVLDFDDALAVVLDHAAGAMASGVEEVALLDARGRVLAVEVRADRDQPPFDRATRDGFAIRAEDLGAQIQIIGQVRAGEIWAELPLGENEAIEIMTGAPLPAGADAVVMVEHVERVGNEFRIAEGRTLKAGENVVDRGSEAGMGEVILPVGTIVGAAEIAAAANCGQARLAVFRRPRVAIVATGDELVELDREPDAQQIRNSNSYGLAALVAAVGGEAVRLPIAMDTRGAVQHAIEAGRRADLLVLSGGVSLGQYDLVEEVLDALGAEFLFTGVTMQPGKPVVFGRLPATLQLPAVYFFGLPGNPVSTQVTFHVFVETIIGALAGAGALGPRFVQGTLAEDVQGRPGLTRMLPARLNGITVKLVGWQGSGDLAANARANCYALLPADREGFRTGEVIRILLR